MTATGRSHCSASALPRFALVDLPLGLPTTSARTSRGAWALYPIGAEVVVVHPDGAVSGPPAEVAAELGRLASRDRQGDLDRQAAWTIQRLLTGAVQLVAGGIREFIEKASDVPSGFGRRLPGALARSPPAWRIACREGPKAALMDDVLW
jgi:hypothetical protein